jgi:two-component system, OmpR family, phosphate regulon sensor histidine kinase PhoR
MVWPWSRDDAPSAPAPQDGDAESLIREIAEALPDPCLVLDRRGTVIAFNGGAADLFDVDLKGAHLSAAVRAPAVLSALAEVLADGMPRTVSFEERAPVQRQFDVHLCPLRRPDPLVLMLLRDISREQRVERLRADFVANASHELRTPLASLMGFIETLQGPAREDAKARDRFLGLMKSQAERMARLIDDLLSLSRVEMSEHIGPSGSVDLAQAARHVCDVLAPLAREQGVELKLDMPDAMAVKGDWDQLVQVTENIVENAIKYAASGKLIEIGGARSEREARLSVRDHGPGIPADHLPRLTERFYRVNVRDSRQRGGTGLGLAIVKHILNRHGGRLTIESEPGRGSTFTIRVPVD